MLYIHALVILDVESHFVLLTKLFLKQFYEIVSIFEWDLLVALWTNSVFVWYEYCGLIILVYHKLENLWTQIS